MSLLVKARWERARSAVFRRAGVVFGDMGRWFMLRVKSAGPPKKSHKAHESWRSLIGQLGNQQAVRELLGCGVLGNDLPRQVSYPHGDRILVLAAHQDDETLGAGGTLLLCASAGKAMHVVYCTDGATGVGRLREHEVVQLRRKEATRIWHKIAGVDPEFLDMPNRGDLSCGEAAGRLAQVIATFRPTTIFVPNFLEQPREHRRAAQLLLDAHAQTPLDQRTEVWGYQITTRLPGNVAVDITSVWRRKYRLNRMWGSQNMALDYAHLAMGRDIASSYYLKGGKNPRRTASHAELFLVFKAPQYFSMARRFLELPQEPEMPAGTVASARPPDFLIIGAQKSGSYWLTAMLDAHPRIRCFPSRPGHEDGSGEAHLFDGLAKLERDFDGFRRTMRAKLDGLFEDLVPAESPAAHERQELLERFRRRFDQYCQLQRLEHGKPIVGEKTTETLHHPELVEAMYPGIRKICILRDPRDRATSFHGHQIRKRRLPEHAPMTQEEVDAYIERVRRDYEGLCRCTDPVLVVTFERLLACPHEVVTGLLQFLDMPAPPDVVQAMVDAGTFERLSGRARGTEDVRSHFRKGVTGDWRRCFPLGAAEHLVAALEPATAAVEARFNLDLSAYRAP